MSQDADEIMGDSISSVEYLSPDMQTSAVQGSRTGNSIYADDDFTSASTTVMVSAGVVCVAIALTMGYRYKNRADAAAFATIGPCGSQITMTSSQLSGNTDSTPGLSTVMSSTYRLGESHCMNSILEGGDSSDTSSHARNISIIVSESGYSQEDSETDSKEDANENELGDYLLGAQRPNSLYRMDQLLDDSFSDIEPPYDSSFDESIPTQRKTYTGQSNPLGPSPLAFLDQDDSYDL